MCRRSPGADRTTHPAAGQSHRVLPRGVLSVATRPVCDELIRFGRPHCDASGPRWPGSSAAARSSGQLADRFGRRTIFLLDLFAFVVLALAQVLVGNDR